MIAGCSGVPRGGGAAGQGISEGHSSSRAPIIQYEPPHPSRPQLWPGQVLEKGQGRAQVPCG